MDIVSKMHFYMAVTFTYFVLLYKIKFIARYFQTIKI